MRLYNTLTKSKDEFSPLKKGEVALYTCGPTTYNYAHIGNFRTYVFEDVLKRALTLSGFKVKHVMNITDVGHLVSDSDEGEDKMEVGAKREGKTAWEIASFYTKAFFEDFRKLNCIMPDIKCKATDHVLDMIEFIKKLEQKGFTYKTSDGIYYDTSKFKDYHKLAGKARFDGLKKGARVEFNSEKRNPTDFALWKFSPKNEKRQMEWDSPWGTGFPGWHIECSVMAQKYLGETLDIHCGGEDHVSIHHTNEIAQSEAVSGKQFVRFWMHGKFLVVKDSAKMSKSSGEFLTVSGMEKKGYAPLDYRYLCLGAHYRTQLEFSWESMDFAKSSLSSLKSKISSLFGDKKEDKGDSKNLEKFKKEFDSAVFDDLNTPKALSVLWDVLKSDLTSSQKISFVEYADKIFGLDLLVPSVKKELPYEALDLIKQREDARKNRDYEKSDELRDRLLEMNITIKDTPNGTEWEIK
jgi:cysteinyl-tRNA synthetase